MANSTTTKPALTGAFDLFGKSKDLVLKNWKVFGILYILPLLSALPSSSNKGTVSNDVLTDFNSGFWAMGIAAIIIFVLAFVALMIVVQAMLYVLQLQVSTGKQPTLSYVWQKTKGRVWRFLGLSIVVGLAITAGLIAFIVPGIIFIRRYFLSTYYMFDKDLGIRESMKRSAADSKPHSGYIWSIIGVTILLSLFSIIPVVGGLISTVLIALYSVAPAIRYQELKKLS